MKTIFISNKNVSETELYDLHRDDAFLSLMGEFKIMESHIIYFSAGEAKIKEILIKKTPSFSV
jgi:hypothetical protein